MDPELTISEIQVHDGQAWFQCPECGGENRIDPDTRISELSSVPRRCTGCEADIFWYDAGGQQRGMVSFGNMGESGMIRRVLPFRRPAC